MRIFVTQPIPEPGVSLLQKAGFEVVVYPEDRVIPREDLLKGVAGVHAVLCMLTNKIDEEFFAAAGPQLKIVANMAVGVDNIDREAAKKRNVMITNTPGVLTNAVAEHTIALMMAVARRIPEADAFTRRGKYEGWGPKLFLGSEIKGKTLGIVGLGRIGFGVAERAVRGLGMRVIYHDVKQNQEFEKQYLNTYRAFDDLLKESDFVSLHVPLIPATHHLIGKKQFALMKKTAYLVNTSRGPIVDEKALKRALKTGQIAGAALDVFEFEPQLTPGFSRLPNIVLTPHIASATIEARSKMSEMVAQAIVDIFFGKTPQNVVTPP